MDNKENGAHTGTPLSDDAIARASARCAEQAALYAKARTEWHDIWVANNRGILKRNEDWFLIGVEWVATQVPELAPVDKSADLHGKSVDEIAELHDQTKVTIAECIAQLDQWAGRLEAAIDRQAHAQLGQHPNDEPAAGGRDPLEQLP